MAFGKCPTSNVCNSCQIARILAWSARQGRRARQRGYELVHGEELKNYNELARQGILSGRMKIENVDVVGSLFGIQQFALAGQGDFNMVFRAANDNNCAQNAREAA